MVEVWPEVVEGGLGAGGIKDAADANGGYLRVAQEVLAAALHRTLRARALPRRKRQRPVAQRVGRARPRGHAGKSGRPPLRRNRRAPSRACRGARRKPTFLARTAHTHTQENVTAPAASGSSAGSLSINMTTRSKPNTSAAGASR
eukprot:GHVT01088862.1.p2 GENE.GHVT01088862.1~~GHVT01088862.1.p2  ORF type:complete len:145 (+),score=27.87 GHVT01088862.1:428-862(+)